MPKFFYGWVVVCGCFLCCLSYGPFYTLGVFFTTLEKEFGWSATLVSSIHSVHLLVFIFSTVLIGWLTDRFGPRLPLILGAVLIGGGIGLLSQIASLGQFYFGYAIASLGAGVIWSLPTTIVQRWFAKGAGLPLGIAVSGVGVGTLVYAPLAHYLIVLFGWRTAYLIIGGGTGLLLLIAFLIVATPQKKGIQPSGAREAAKSIPDEETGWEAKLAIATTSFFTVALIQFFTVLPIHMVATHLVRFAELNGIAKGIASAAWGLVGGMSILGRIFVPALAEKTIGWTRTITFCTLICAACFLWLIGVKEPWMLYVFVIIYGFFYGGKVPLIPATLRFFFGTKALGRLSGAAHAISLVGGALGPILAGYIVDVSGSYLIAFLVGAVFWVAAGVLAWFVRQPTVSVKEKVCFFKE